MQVSFRLGHGLLPLVGTHGAQLREQLVLVHLDSPTVGCPVGQKTQQSECWRPKDVDGGAQAVERLQQLVGPSARNALVLAQRLPSDPEVVPGGAGSRDPVRLGVRVDLASQLRVDLDADETEAARLRAVVAFSRPLLRRTFRGWASRLPGLGVALHATSERPRWRS